MSTAATATAAPRPISAKQIMSLLGLFPLGTYVVAHLWTNLYSLAGPEAFNARLAETNRSPVFIFLEVFGLGLPVLVHTVIGFRLMFRMRLKNQAAYPTLRNLKYVLQRFAGVGVLLFLIAHVIKARIMPAMAGGHETWQGMHEAFKEADTLTVYALGMLGVSYHLGNGLWGASLTLGLAVTPKAQARMEKVSAAFFALLLGMSYLAIYGFLRTPK